MTLSRMYLLRMPPVGRAPGQMVGHQQFFLQLPGRSGLLLGARKERSAQREEAPAFSGLVPASCHIYNLDFLSCWSMFSGEKATEFGPAKWAVAALSKACLVRNLTKDCPFTSLCGLECLLSRGPEELPLSKVKGQRLPKATWAQAPNLSLPHPSPSTLCPPEKTKLLMLTGQSGLCSRWIDKASLGLSVKSMCLVL